ncbi:hypothetical protein RHCRD62_10717 [Rhodococcus sp. RD6.2]|nr:hypothetical protein RHCRD62_10717 [Rhodococcus sp. RD6.2]
MEGLQDRRRRLALPQRTGPPRGLTARRTRPHQIGTPRHAPRRHPVLLQRRFVRLRLPGQLHPPDAGRTRLPHGRDAAHRPGRVR